MVSLVHYSMLDLSLQYLFPEEKWHGMVRARMDRMEIIDGALRCRQKR
jgi:hypothetical protein